MSRPRPSPTLQTVGDDEEGRRPPVTPLVALIAVFALVVSWIGATGNDGRPDTTALLHELGGPVDVVEQLVASINYGQSAAVVRAVAADADVVQLPFLPAARDQIRTSLRIHRDIRASIEMFGCTERGSPPGLAASEVTCSIRYNSDFIRHLDSEYLRGTLEARVANGLISELVVDLESPRAEPADLTDRFEDWLFDQSEADVLTR